MRDLLLFRLGGLGDLLVALPSIALAKLAPESGRLTLVCRAGYGQLLREAGLADELVDAGSREASRWFAAAPAWTPEENAALARFGGVVAWLLKAGDFPPVEAARRAGLAMSRAISPPRDLWVPLSRFFFEETAALLGARAEGPLSFAALSRLTVREDRRRAALRAAGLEGARYAVVHPGSGSPSKCWPLRRFLLVAARLSAAGLRGIIVTGEAEERLESELATLRLPPGWSRLARPPLLDLAGLLPGAALYAGNDSGVTHLAAACGAPVAAAFRTEYARLWRPFGRTRVVEGPSLEEISVEAFLEAAASLVPSLF